MAEILDGKKLAGALRARLTDFVSQFQQRHNRVPGLLVIQVGDHPASQIYIRNKTKAAASCGIDGRILHLPENCAEQKLLDAVMAANRDPRIDGILVQLPLPPHIDPNSIIHAIDPAKDVDGFHPENVGRLLLRRPGFQPCTPQGVMYLLRHTGQKLAGKYAVVLGRSAIVGSPTAQLLLQADCSVTMLHSKSSHLKEHISAADIVVAAIGKANFVAGEWIKPGAIVIDVGINRISQSDGSNQLFGDVDFAAAKSRAGWITPVPGGVGPMTIAFLLVNTVNAACQREHSAPFQAVQ